MAAQWQLRCHGAATRGCDTKCTLLPDRVAEGFLLRHSSPKKSAFGIVVTDRRSCATRFGGCQLDFGGCQPDFGGC